MDAIMKRQNCSWIKKFLAHFGEAVVLVVLFSMIHGCSSGGGEDTAASSPPSAPPSAIPTYDQCIVPSFASNSFSNSCGLSLNVSYFDQGFCQLLCGPQTIVPGGIWRPLTTPFNGTVNWGACAPPYTVKISKSPPNPIYFCA